MRGRSLRVRDQGGDAKARRAGEAAAHGRQVPARPRPAQAATVPRRSPRTPKRPGVAGGAAIAGPGAGAAAAEDSFSGRSPLWSAASASTPLHSNSRPTLYLHRGSVEGSSCSNSRSTPQQPSAREARGRLLAGHNPLWQAAAAASASSSRPLIQADLASSSCGRQQQQRSFRSTPRAVAVPCGICALRRPPVPARAPAAHCPPRGISSAYVSPTPRSSSRVGSAVAGARAQGAGSGSRGRLARSQRRRPYAHRRKSGSSSSSS